MSVEIPGAFRGLFKPSRYKVYYGGRGGGKSWAIATALLITGLQRPLRVLCAREYQNSIADSVHKLLCDICEKYPWGKMYRPTKDRIYGPNGTEFIFCGLHHNVNEIKSKEGIDVCWVEEAQSVSEESWQILIPTIRKVGSEIWISFNPYEEKDPTYQRFVKNPPPNSQVVKVGWRENPWFPDVLKAEMEHCREVDPEQYMHVWEGNVKQISDAVVFKNKFVVEPFETPLFARFYHGADWGFAKDPTTLVRCFIQDRRLYIDQEAYGVGVELDDTPALFDTIDTARKWPIKADCARPETISHIRRKGFPITAAKKWGGSVEDGVEFLRSFDKIVIHPRCVHTAEEFAKYSYKMDKQTMDILPVIEDAWNHCIDALRYALDGMIKGHGTMKIDPKILSHKALEPIKYY